MPIKCHQRTVQKQDCELRIKTFSIRQLKKLRARDCFQTGICLRDHADGRKKNGPGEVCEHEPDVQEILV